MELSTVVQIILCLIIYGGWVALVIEFWWKSRQNKKAGYPRPNPIGDLEDEPDR